MAHLGGHHDESEHEKHYRLVCGPQMDRLEVVINAQTKILQRHEETIGALTRMETVLEAHTQTIRDHGDKLGRISEKVFNGFGNTVDAVNIKLDIEIKRNAEEFRRVHNSLSSIIKFGATSVIMIFVALLGVIGSIWISDRASNQEIRDIRTEQVRVELLRTSPQYMDEEVRDAPIDTPPVQGR